MGWWQLTVASRYPEFAEEVLLTQGAASVTLSDAADDPVLEPAPGQTPLWAHTLAHGLFDDEGLIEPARAALREQLPDGSALSIELRTIEDADWVNAWLQHAQPMQFGAHLWVCPSGHRIDDERAIVVQLDPGLAFGTGTHPSTALCLDWLATHDVAGAQVLDYGCGSGILAIAAVKLGATRASAIDIDPQALTATRDNAERNGVSDLIDCVGAEAAAGAPVDLVLANILARPLMTLAPMLAARTRIGGHIVLAGILDAQAQDVRAAYAPWFEFESDAQREVWSRVSGVRRR
ncbi:MAG: ribosomal protein methyltransferase [Nevskia sp.]|nr:ribosomal protein methyltransferase [Nevskia sp.]